MNRKQWSILSAAALVISMAAGTSAGAADGAFSIALSEDDEAWNYVAMANDDKVDTGIVIRSEMDTDSPAKGYLYRGGAVTVLDQANGWTKVRSGNVTGYVRDEYLTFGTQAKGLAEYYGEYGVRASWDDVKVFAWDDKDAKIVGTVNDGDTYPVVNNNGHWLEVQTGKDETAYVSEEDTDLVILVDSAYAIDEEKAASEAASDKASKAGNASKTGDDVKAAEPAGTESEPAAPAAQEAVEAEVPAQEPAYEAPAQEATYEEPAYEAAQEVSYEEASYEEPAQDASYADTSYTDSSYTEDTSYTDSSYTEDTSYTDSSYTEDTSYTDASYTEDTSYTDASYTEDTSYADGSGAEDTSSYDIVYGEEGSDTLTYEDNGSADTGVYDDDSWTDDGSYTEEASYTDDSAYTEDDSAYTDDGAYDDGTYDDGTYDDGTYDDGTYDDGTYDDGSYTEDTSSSAASSDVDLLAAIIYHEAGNQSEEGKIAVGAVVLNRVNSGSFPGTISEVLYQPGQFTPAGELASTIASGVPSSCYDAAYAALGGQDPTGGCLYFNTSHGSGVHIGDHWFY